MAEILIYGIVGDSFDKLDAATVTTAIRASTGPLSVRINSPGGYVMEGLAIIEALRSYPGKVTIYIDGLAASMASAIAMVGSEIIMAESALMMVHKPWDSSIGNADDLRRDAAKLDRIEAQLIGIYAKQTGLPEGELAGMLAAETWLTPQEALEKGFITSISEQLKLAAMAKATGFGFRHLPETLKEITMDLYKTRAALVAAIDKYQKDGGTQAEAEKIVASAISLDAKDALPTSGTLALLPAASDPNGGNSAQAVTIERNRVSSIMALGSRHGLPTALTQDLISRGIPIEQARATILDHLAADGDRLSIGHSMGHQTLDNPATYAEAIRDALVAKISGKAAEGPAAEFQGMSVVDIGRDYLSRNGTRDVLRMSPDRVINAAMTSGGRGSGWGFRSDISGGMHTSSDFPDLIQGAAEKYLVERYRLQESPLKRLARQTSRSNFLTQYGVQLDGFGPLDAVNEAGEFKNRTINTRKEGYALQTYGNIFAVSRQMLINDALQALANVLTMMASEAAETEALVIAAIINTYVMADGKAWFHADHGNLAATGAPPSVESLDAGRVAMRSQKTKAGGRIDAKPKFLVVPVGLETAAETLVASTIAPTTTDQVNPFAGKLEAMADPRLSSATAWYLFADPAFSAALEYAYLNGQTAPFTDSQDGWRVDGTEYKVRHDFGAGVIDHRLAWKNPGA